MSGGRDIAYESSTLWKTLWNLAWQQWQWPSNIIKRSPFAYCIFVYWCCRLKRLGSFSGPEWAICTLFEKFVLQSDALPSYSTPTFNRVRSWLRNHSALAFLNDQAFYGSISIFAEWNRDFMWYEVNTNERFWICQVSGVGSIDWDS